MKRYKRYEAILRPCGVRESEVDYEISCASELYDFADRVIGMSDFLEERFYVVYINAKGKIVGFEEIAKGGISMCPVEPQQVFRGAILKGVPTIALLHNHPSGVPEPSLEDQVLTRRLKKAGDILQIRVIDHIVCGDNDYFSFAGNDLLEERA